MTNAVHTQLVQGALQLGALQFGEYPVQGTARTRPYSFDVSRILADPVLADTINNEMVKLYENQAVLLAMAKSESCGGFFLNKDVHGLSRIAKFAHDNFDQLDVTSTSGLQNRKNVYVFVGSFGADSEGQQLIKEIESNGSVVGAIFTIFATQETGAAVPPIAEDVPIIPILTLHTLIHHLPSGQDKSKLDDYRIKFAPTAMELTLPMNVFR